MARGFSVTRWNIIAGMVNFLEEDFKKWQSFDKIPRVASHTPFGVIAVNVRPQITSPIPSST